jgi:hypothetical protein
MNGVCTKNVIGNFTETVLRLSEEVGHLCKNIDILKMKVGNISTAERPSVSPYAQESLTRIDVTSLAAPKNKAVKICKDALTACCVLLSKIPPISAYFLLSAASRNETDEEPTLPEISRNIHNADTKLKGDLIHSASFFPRFK